MDRTAPSPRSPPAISPMTNPMLVDFFFLVEVGEPDGAPGEPDFGGPGVADFGAPRGDELGGIEGDPAGDNPVNKLLPE